MVSAALHTVGSQAFGLGNLVAASPYYIEKGFNYLSGRQSCLFSGWNEKQSQFFNKAEDWMYRAVATDRNHPDYLMYRGGFELATVLAGGYGVGKALYKGAQWGINGFRMSRGAFAAGEGLTKQQAVTHIWPPNNGFLNSGRSSLVPGSKVDRFGELRGRFLALEGTPISMRSLPLNAPQIPYRSFKVVRPFEVEAGPAAPWFEQPGMGMQFKTDIQIQQLIDSGHLKITKEILK